MINLKYPTTIANKTSWRFFVVGIFCYFISASSFAQAENPSENPKEILVKKIEFNQQNNLEITLSRKGDFKIFTLKDPSRLVVDIKNAALEDPALKPVIPYFITTIRTRLDQNYLRIVFDLNQKVSIEKTSFQKVKNQNYGKIIAQFSAIKTSTTPAKPAKSANDFAIKTQKITNPDGSTKYVVIKTPKTAEADNATINIEQTAKNSSYQITKKIPIIVIDSGHGGKDPGTIGNYARTKEKNITLSYAKELKKHLDNTKHYKVFLTRDNDFFIPLRKRVEKARKLKADLFISLHANSVGDSQVSGLSIYTLSEKSSDKQAELLAQKENRSDIIAGINFDGASQDIMKTLIDLSQRDVKNSSSSFANTAIKVAKNSNIQILQNTHRFAGFAVLTAPDMVSVLIELGYLSNRQEENLLNGLIYKRKVAESLVNAIDEYFSKIKN